MSDRRDLPYWIDDSLVDRAAHRLDVRPDMEATVRTGWPSVFGSCSCGEWVTPSWDSQAVTADFDQHMARVQQTAHQSAPGGAEL